MGVTEGRVRFDEPMRHHTTFHIGGPAEIWVEPRNRTELGQLLEVAKTAELPVTLVGGGANLLVRDEGIPGLVIHLGSPGFQEFRRTDSDSAIAVGAGLPLEWLIRRSKEAGLSGVEFLAGVPGRVGGAIRMNAGTHDEQGEVHSISDVVRSITGMDLQGQIRTLPKEEVGFAYRSSRLNGCIVLEATLALAPEDPERIDQKVQQLWAFKKRTQDWTAPSVGCIFKNPPQPPAASAEGCRTTASWPAAAARGSGTTASWPAAGWMIERVGLKGHRIGGAAISTVHSNFIINLGDAKAADVLALIEETRARVLRQFAVELELEVKVVG